MIAASVRCRAVHNAVAAIPAFPGDRQSIRFTVVDPIAEKVPILSGRPDVLSTTGQAGTVHAGLGKFRENFLGRD
jgi:hypothetical protein